MTEVEQPRLPGARTMSVDPPTLNLNKRGPPSSDGHEVNDNSKPIDKRRRISRMDTVAYDDIAPGEHAEQDERVKKKFLANIELGLMPALDMLLLQIVKNCDKMNADYRDPGNAEETLETHPALKEELEEAWKDGTFTRIRLLKILRPAASQPQPDAVIVVSRHDSLRRSEAAWEVPFHGHAHEALRHHLDELNANFIEDGPDYAKFIPIVQSSGTGKSRMMDELAKEVYVIPLNLRDPSETGYPRADTGCMAFLTSATDEDDLTAKTWTFLYCLLDGIARVVQGLQAEGSQSPLVLRDFFRDRKKREGFYEEVLQNTTKSISATKQQNSISKASRDRTPPPLERPLPTSPRKPRISRIVFRADVKEPALTDAGEDVLREAAKKLTDLLLSTKQSAKKSVAVILAIDEIHPLTKVITSDNVAPFTVLRRAIREFRQSPIFTVVMSTNGSIRKIAPSPNLSNSDRVQTGRRELYAPFVEVGFDQLATPPQPGWMLDDFCSLDYIVSLGRPLFASLHSTQSQDIITFAQEKLTLVSSDRPLSLDAQLACIGVRIPLDFQPRAFDLSPKSMTPSQVREVEERQVERHLRLVIAIQPKKETILTVAPSEPVLAEASARRKFNRWATLAHFVDEGCISKGDCGELYMMQVILNAMDSAALTLPQMPKIPRYHTPIPLVLFLRQLLHRDHIPKVLGAHCSSRPETLATYYEKSYVHCTHFVRVREGNLLEPQHLARFLERGVGILCKEGQEGIDLCIPVTMDKSVAPGSMTAVMVQVRNRELNYSKWNAAVYNEFRKMGGVDDRMGLGHEPINLIVSLGAEALVSTTRDTPVTKSEKDQSRTEDQLSGFNIFVGGYTHQTFNAVQASDVDKITVLLRHYDPFSELFSHLEQGGQRAEILRTMLPAQFSDMQHWKYRSPDSNV